MCVCVGGDISKTSLRGKAEQEEAQRGTGKGCGAGTVGAEPKGLDLRMARRNATRGTHQSPELENSIQRPTW